jgi:hypothetical protein
MRRSVLYFLLLALMGGSVNADDHPLGFVLPYDWADFTAREKELYVSGVIDGQIYLLYGASSPELEPLLTCVKKEGIKAVVRATEVHLAFGDDIKNPLPWAIAKGLGNVCKAYRKK